jgi:hypothetical protein
MLDKEKVENWVKITQEQKKYVVSSGATGKQDLGSVKYSIDELTVAYILYGQHSKIYLAMQRGELVSKLIVEKMKERTSDFVSVDFERKLLERCLKREKFLGV